MATLMLSAGIFMVQTSNDNLSEYLENLLNDPNLMLQEGSTHRKIAELGAAADDAWQVYAKTAAGVTFALTDGPKSLNGMDAKQMRQKVTRLLITKSEIEQLKRHLRQSFGPVLADRTKAKVVDMPAIILWDFLNDKWTPASK